MIIRVWGRGANNWGVLKTWESLDFGVWVCGEGGGAIICDIKVCTILLQLVPLYQIFIVYPVHIFKSEHISISEIVHAFL